MATETVELTVPDISCEHCAHTVTQALNTVQGVESVNVDVPSKTVRVQFDPQAANVDAMKEALAEEDYPVAAVS